VKSWLIWIVLARAYSLGSILWKVQGLRCKVVFSFMLLFLLKLWKRIVNRRKIIK
jgi:hypothetical protein